MPTKNALKVNHLGNIALFIIIAVFFALILLPATYSPPPPEIDLDCNEIPDPNIEKFPPYNYEDQGFDDSKQVDYKLIRKSIYISKNFFDPNPNPATNKVDPPKAITYKTQILSDGLEYKIFYPDKITGISTSMFDTTWKFRSDAVFMQYGIIVVVPLDQGSKETIINGFQQDGKEIPLVKVDIYQDVTNKKTLDPFWLSCNPSQYLPVFYLSEQEKAELYFPNQNRSPDKEQLQLEWFLFQKGQVKFGWQVHCKPAIYLYPKNPTLVNVKVFPKGELTYTDPKYNQQNGWSVLAYPDGRLDSINGKEHGYLYYEARIFDKEIKKPTEGFVIKYEELSHFYQQLLPKLGFNPIEQKDFIEYWQKYLKYSPYYFVGIMSQQQLDHIEPLAITPHPDTIKRISFFFEAMNEYKQIPAPEISTFNRNGFTLFEWGGLVKNYHETAYTCSQ